MSAPTAHEVSFALEWQAKYIRRATAIADAIAQYSGGEGSSDRIGDADIAAGAALFLSSYLERIADEAEANFAAFRGNAQ